MTNVSLAEGCNSLIVKNVQLKLLMVCPNSLQFILRISAIRTVEAPELYMFQLNC